MPMNEFHTGPRLTAEELKTGANLMNVRGKRIAKWRKSSGLSNLAAQMSGEMRGTFT